MVRVAMYGKGGIGKSTMSSNLTAALTEIGQKVLQIGCDPKHDSTRLLLGGEVKSTILDYMKETPKEQRRLEDVVSEGYGGCLCAEAGGPEPGVGCAGRGIISSFDLLKELGGDSLYRDVTLYDVLGDVVCGGFAVPLRNEYAELIFVVSSGEFMSIYAANNILKGVCNYDPDRVGGIIFNSRGDPEEEIRIRKFSESVGIPIIASFDRSELFMTAEESGKTVVEMYPKSGLAKQFRDLAREVMKQRKYRANYLDERELEQCILGRTLYTKEMLHKPIKLTVTDNPKKKYLSRNVMNDEPYGGCAFSGAHSTCSSTKGLATVLHSPLSCAQLTFQTVSNTCGRYRDYHEPIEAFIDPCVNCSKMSDSDMIFGGTEKLEKELEACLSRGERDIAVVTSCPSGIIGDDVKSVVSRFQSKNEGVRIALIETDGNLNGDFMQGVIDSGIALCETFAEHTEPTDTVNLIGTKALALNCLTSVSIEEELLNRLGVKVNCLFPAGSSVESLSHIDSARLNIMTNPDFFTIQLCTYLEERFGIQLSPVPVRPGIRGTLSWLGYVADMFGKQKEFGILRKELEEEFRNSISRYSRSLRGKRFCILSASKDIDWILEATEAVGMERLRATVVDRSDYSNDMNVTNEYPGIEIVKKIDIEKERKVIEELAPDLVISTMPIGLDIPFISVPLVQTPGPFSGVEYIKRINAILISSKKEGWRKDVV